MTDTKIEVGRWIVDANRRGRVRVGEIVKVTPKTASVRIRTYEYRFLLADIKHTFASEEAATKVQERITSAYAHYNKCVSEAECRLHTRICKIFNESESIAK